MILTSHQPNFLPYMGVFYKAYRSDILVLSEDVWYSKSGMHNYNFIRTKEGVHKLTLPVKAHHDTRLCDVIVSEPEISIPKIVKSLRETYARTEHQNEGQEIIEIIEKMNKPELKMTELNIAIIKHILSRMSIQVEVLEATKDLSIYGHKDERIFQMCEKTGAKIYYSGIGAKAYHNEDLYKEKGIKLVYSDYAPVIYKQKYDPFIPNMSVFDYICNEGYRIPEGWQ